jgi:hypothetical protein
MHNKSPSAWSDVDFCGRAGYYKIVALALREEGERRCMSCEGWSWRLCARSVCGLVRTAAAGQLGDHGVVLGEIGSREL